MMMLMILMIFMLATDAGAEQEKPTPSQVEKGMFAIKNDGVTPVKHNEALKAVLATSPSTAGRTSTCARKRDSRTRRCRRPCSGQMTDERRIRKRCVATIRNVAGFLKAKRCDHRASNDESGRESGPVVVV